MMNITFTTITNHDGPLTKTIRPDGNGCIIKKPSAHLINGTAEIVKLPFEEFGPYLRTLSSNQAILHGVCNYEKANVVSVAKFQQQPQTVARTLDFFRYPEGAGIGMFDHDPKAGQKALTPKELIGIIRNTCPEFGNLPTWCTPSTSSCIYDRNGNELSGTGNGFHLYFPFEPASNLPAFADWLFKRLWIAGYGYVIISRAGSLLTRTIFDASVFSPERLDFVAGANCIDCEQRLPEPVYREGAEVMV